MIFFGEGFYSWSEHIFEKKLSLCVYNVVCSWDSILFNQI